MQVFGYTGRRKKIQEINFIRDKLDVPRENIFIGDLKVLMKRLEENDVLYIGHLDELGVNYADILNNWRLLMNKKINVIVLKMPAINTFKENIAETVTQILSYVAIQHRQVIKQKRLRISFDELSKEELREFIEAYKLLKHGISKTVAAKKCKMKYTSFLYRVSLIENGKLKISTLENKETVIASENALMISDQTNSYQNSFRRWMGGELSAEKAAKLCNMSDYEFRKKAHADYIKTMKDYAPNYDKNDVSFDFYMDELEKEKKSVSENTLRSKVLQAYRQYKKNKITLAEAASKCCLSLEGFQSMIEKLLAETSEGK